MSIRGAICLSLLLAKAGCGGGGSSSSPNPQPINPPPGGGAGGSANVVIGGLISGGARINIDTSVVGVNLDVAVGGTGLVAGDIQGFGSVIANGVTVNTDSAEFLIEGQMGVQADLKQGQQVLLLGDTGSNVASQVLYRSNIRGPVTAVSVQDLLLGQATFTVLGQIVVSDSSTTYANVNVASVAINSELEVSGVLQDDGAIRATFVEQKIALAQYKLTGQVSGVSQNELTIGGLTVDFANASLQDFDGMPIENGDVVEVEAAPGDFTSPNLLSAREVEKLPILTIGGDAVVRVEGFVDRFSSATDFDVQTTPIRTDVNTVFINGDVSSLALDAKVQIEGSGDGLGAILARRIIIQPEAAIRVAGNIEAIDTTAATVTVLGVVFQLRDLTEIEDNSSLEVDPLGLVDLGIGDEVEVRGYLDDATVVATALEREGLEDGAELRGIVGNIDAESGAFDLQGVPIIVQSGITDFLDLDENIVSQAAFFDLIGPGTTATAKWDVFAATSVVADEVSLEEDD